MYRPKPETRWFVISVAVVIILGGCFSFSKPAGEAGSVKEHPVVLIALDGPITDRRAELSGLAWYGDTMILLAQYPDRFGAGDGALFAIPKQSIIDFLDNKSSQPITPTMISFVAPGIKDGIKRFEGYEAIGFSGRNVYLTIESGKDEKMLGYLVGGEISADGGEIRLDVSHLTPITPPIPLDNRTDEALVIVGDRLLTFYEVNGSRLNLKPSAHVFDLELSAQSTITFPSLEYLVTDATLAPDGKIWVLNQFEPEDTDVTNRNDPLAEQYGRGATHTQYEQVERLVALEYHDFGFTLADVAPIQLELTSDARNWEGLVALDNRGFLLVTDKSPGTLLGFVAR